MGGDISTAKPPPSTDLTHKNDQRYGGPIMIDRTKSKIYQVLDVDERGAEDFKMHLESRKKLQHPNFITVHRSWVEKYRESCSLHRMFKVTLEYIYIENCLEDRIMHYCNLRTPYPEGQLRKVFRDVVSCLHFLAQNGTCHGDIKPKNIMIGSNGRAFLTDSYFINRGRVAYEIVMEDPESLSLLSPQQLTSLREKKFVSLKNIHDDEMFAVGLTLLEAMTAEPAMQCYDLANLRIKNGYFDKKYQQMRSYGYSHQLCALVMECLQPLPEHRATFPQFLDAIKY